MTPMDDLREAHLEGIKIRVCNNLEAKYRRGQEEHGGHLWRKGLDSLIAREIRAEALDLIVYSDVLLERLRQIREICVEGATRPNDVDGYQQILRILNGDLTDNA